MIAKRLPGILILSIAVLLAACGGSAASPTPATAPTVAPTGTANTSQVNPTSAPTEDDAATATTEAATSTVVAEVSPTDGPTVPGAESPTPTREPTARATNVPNTGPTAEPTTEATGGPTVGATTAPTEGPTDDSTPTSGPRVTAGTEYEGTVTNGSGDPVVDAWVYAGDAIGRTNANGHFSVQASEGARDLTVMAPGYKKYTAPLGKTDVGNVELEAFAAKGVYVSGIGDPKVRNKFYKLLDDTELNALIINVKNDTGNVWTSKVPLARETKASYEDFILADFVKEAHSRGIYVIGRFTVFRDESLANARPDMAVQDASGNVWGDNQDHNWADPFDREVWDYFGDLGEEIASSGIDEIQFDYVRFPVDGDLDEVRYSQESTEESRIEAITGFLEYMENRLRPHKVFIAADTFGLTIVDLTEQGTGQILENMAQHLDYFCPMIYPDHFGPGEFGWRIPSAHPYDVIYSSIEQAQKKLEGMPVVVRPWLSAFKDTQYDQPFGLEQFLAQKKAAEDAGAVGWMFWNAALTYDPGTFRKE